MESLGLLRPPPVLFSSRPRHPYERFERTRRRSGPTISCSPARVEYQPIDPPKASYKPGLMDDLLLKFFRSKMVEEVGWDSDKPGYDGLIEVVNRLMMKSRSNAETEQSAFQDQHSASSSENIQGMKKLPLIVRVRVLESLFPPFLLPLFKMLVSPIGGGKAASMMLARATAISCQWLMGTCSVNSIELPDGSPCTSGVFVEKCKYLEESKCVGICINTCKVPTQTFFKDYMGVPLHMEPNFTDYSCQFKFGVLPASQACDNALQEPCLEICPTANRRRELSRNADPLQCPKV